MSMNIINNYIVFWPGVKPKQDTILNMLGDTFGTIIGLISAYYVDKIGNKYGLYTLHIK